MRAALAGLVVWCFVASAQPVHPALGVVIDPSGALIANARITVLSPQGTALGSLMSDSGGTFSVSGMPQGSYALEVVAAGFEKGTAVITMPPATGPLVIQLQIARTNSEITVTSQRGAVEDVESATQFVTSRGPDQLSQRPLATIANALEGAPGVAVQQTTYGASSPILRGLMGYQTLLLLDGIRFNTSIFRNGPNQYLALLDPGIAERIEVTLGPSGSNYGSDSMGGTINVVTPQTHFAPLGHRRDIQGELNVLGATADFSGAANGRISLGGPNVAISIGASGARHSDVRGGRGDDSHNVYRRYFGLNRDQLQRAYGDRLQNTGFLQYSADARLSARFASDQSLTFTYLRSDMQDVRSYRDQFGGANKIQSRFDPQSLNFASARYEKLGFGPFDSICGTFSFNQQNDGAIQQNALLTDIITNDDSQVNAYGYSAQAASHIGHRQTIVFGGELYRERIFSKELIFSPATAATSQNRGLYPNNSLYRIGSLFAQNTAELTRLLRVTLGLRYTGVRYATRAADNLDVSGKSLGVIDSGRSFEDMTFNAALQWQATRVFAVTANVGRGFRAPNANDLGTIGARTLGYDVPGEDAMAANALLGLDSSDSSGRSGKKIRPLRSETLMNYEIGFRLQTASFYVRSHFFDSELRDPISSRTLIFPVGQVPAAIGGVPVTPLSQSAIQQAQGVVAVVTGLTPRSVKTAVNDGETRYFGNDTYVRYRLSPQWTIESNYSFLGGLDLDPVRPTRRLPPQEGAIRLRFTPSGRRPWAEVAVRAIGPQLRLNGGDIDDDRIGASRRRSDIATFARSYSVSPFILAGADGRLGTLDDVFVLTGETIRQIQDRVLPLNATINGVTVANDGIRVPLYPGTPGWVSVSFRGGYPVSERTSAMFGVNNVLDRNYRVIGSGVDGPGINVFAGIRRVF